MSVLAVGSGERLDPGRDHRRSNQDASLPDRRRHAGAGEGDRPLTGRGAPGYRRPTASTARQARARRADDVGHCRLSHTSPLTSSPA